ncbi:unnamed protein product [Kuraishia capsulata CBS 1993]|uniref:RWD domain-containing protein n=1 Tax=Kuraishia capsulata CBS 1993 TaxID=1382522 RepID=W6MMG2_9ASCO|nr:uncharacterized protein KUCA_T00003715001 [Kuraishia capsulata CBS 1993]CDK27736.1 unnamed protein product [Kuraishia capsulata CBS 1993]
MNELFHDEIGAIDAIYPDYMTKISPWIYEFQIPQHEHVKVRMLFPATYPDAAPQIKNVSVDGYTSIDFEKACRETLKSVYNEGDVCIFDFFTDLDPILYDLEETDARSKPKSEEVEDLTHDLDSLGIGSETELDDIPEDIPEQTVFQYDEIYVYNPDDWKWDSKKNEDHHEKHEKSNKETHSAGWVISEPIVDRKSTFIAFTHPVNSDDDVTKYFNELTQDKKIARANHLMRAWRIKLDNGAIIHDYDDDGETAAGSRLLNLLTVSIGLCMKTQGFGVSSCLFLGSFRELLTISQIMDVWNVMVVVGRWFGGLHIGPDRFRHINSSAREAIVKAGYLDDRTPKKTKSRKK